MSNIGVKKNTLCRQPPRRRSVDELLGSPPRPLRWVWRAQPNRRGPTRSPPAGRQGSKRAVDPTGTPQTHPTSSGHLLVLVLDKKLLQLDQLPRRKLRRTRRDVKESAKCRQKTPHRRRHGGCSPLSSPPSWRGPCPRWPHLPRWGFPGGGEEKKMKMTAEEDEDRGRCHKTATEKIKRRPPTTKNCMEGNVSPSGSGSGAGGCGTGGCSGRTGPVTSSSSSSSSSVILMSKSSVYFLRLTCRFDRRFWKGKQDAAPIRAKTVRTSAGGVSVPARWFLLLPVATAPASPQRPSCRRRRCVSVSSPPPA